VPHAATSTGLVEAPATSVTHRNLAAVAAAAMVPYDVTTEVEIGEIPPID
jgi:hypothetical protein